MEKKNSTISTRVATKLMITTSESQPRHQLKQRNFTLRSSSILATWLWMLSTMSLRGDIVGYLASSHTNLPLPNKIQHITETSDHKIEPNFRNWNQFFKKRPFYLVRYESTGTPSTVKTLLSTPETFSSSSICRLIFWETPSTKLFDCTMEW